MKAAGLSSYPVLVFSSPAGSIPSSNVSEPEGSALKQLLENPCGRSPFQESNKVEMAQRDIPRKISRRAAENNRIADEAVEASLAPRVYVAVEERACCSTAALGERGLEIHHGKEAETDRSNSQSSGLRKRSDAVPLHHQEAGRVKLAFFRGKLQLRRRKSGTLRRFEYITRTHCGGTPNPQTTTVRRETTKL